MFGTSSSKTAVVVVSCLALARWALTLSSSGERCFSSLYIPAQADVSSRSGSTTAHATVWDEHRAVTPAASSRPLRPERSPSFDPDSTFSSWAHLTPSPLAASGRPTTASTERLTAFASGEAVEPPSSAARVKGVDGRGKTALRSSFLSLNTAGDTEQRDQDALELHHPYLHSRTLPATYASSVDEADDEDEHGRSEDLVIPPSPSPLPGRLRSGRISPSLPPTFTSRPSRISHRAHHSLPPLLITTSSHRPFPPPDHGRATPDGDLSSSPTVERPIGRGRRMSSGMGTLPLLARKLSRGLLSSPAPVGAEPTSRFPHSRTSRSPEKPRQPTHPSTDAPSSTYFSPFSSPRPVQASRSASHSPKKLRRPSLPRFSSVPDTRSLRSPSPGPNSTMSLSSRTRRRSGSVGSLLRSVAAGHTHAAGTTASGRSSLTPTPTGDMSWWDVEPNESEDDPFARSAPPSVSSASLRGTRSIASLRTSARSTLDVADEAGAITLRRALEAIHEPATESREGSARTSRRYSAERSDDEEHDELERIRTPAPSRASMEVLAPVLGLHRQVSSTGSQFREHLDSPMSPASAASISSFSGVSAGDLVGFGRTLPSGNALGLETPLVPSTVTPRRRRTDQKASMSPSALVHDALRHTPQVTDDDEAERKTVPQLLFGGRVGGAEQRKLDPTSSAVQRESPFPTTRSSRARPSILPVTSSPASLASAPPSTLRRQGSFLTRSKRTTSSPSLLTTSALALRRLRRRSSSPQEASRSSESSDLSFACRGPSVSGSDLGVSSVSAFRSRTVPPSSSDGDNALEVVEADEATAVQSGAGLVRKPWWNRLPGSRASTPYLRSSVSSMLPRRSSSTRGLSLARSASLSSSALAAPGSFLDGHSNSSASSYVHVRSNSLPLLSGRNALRWSQLQLPPVHDVSPFGSSIFQPRRSGSSGERPREPIPSLPASLAAQHALLRVDVDAHPDPRSSFLSVGSSALSRTSSSMRRISSIRREDVVHELDDLVGSLGASFVGPQDEGSVSGSYEFPERSFSTPDATGSVGRDTAVITDNSEQAAHEDEAMPVSSVDSAATPTSRSDSLATSTPLSALFSPLLVDEGWRRPSVVSTSEGDELRSPLTPASGRWGSFSDSSGLEGGEWRVWREDKNGVVAQDASQEEETVEVVAGRA